MEKNNNIILGSIKGNIGSIYINDFNFLHTFFSNVENKIDVAEFFNFKDYSIDDKNLELKENEILKKLFIFEDNKLNHDLIDRSEYTSRLLIQMILQSQTNLDFIKNQWFIKFFSIIIENTDNDTFWNKIREFDKQFYISGSSYTNDASFLKKWLKEKVFKNIFDLKIFNENFVDFYNTLEKDVNLKNSFDEIFLDFIREDEKFSDKKHIIEILKKPNSSFLYNLIKRNNNHFSNDAELDIYAVKSDGLALEFVSTNSAYYNDIENFALNQNPLALEFARSQTKNNKQKVLELVKRNGLALKFVSEELKNDEEVVMEAIKQNGLALEFASYFKKQDRNIVIEAIKQNPSSFKFAPSEMFENEKE